MERELPPAGFPSVQPRIRDSAHEYVHGTLPRGVLYDPHASMPQKPRWQHLATATKLTATRVSHEEAPSPNRSSPTIPMRGVPVPRKAGTSFSSFKTGSIPPSPERDSHPHGRAKWGSAPEIIFSQFPTIHPVLSHHAFCFSRPRRSKHVQGALTAQPARCESGGL